jgi:hypothetical protein
MQNKPSYNADLSYAVSIIHVAISVKLFVEHGKLNYTLYATYAEIDTKKFYYF